MSRHEADRENLLRDATALRQRAEFRVPGCSHRVIAGYRDDGALSIYFGPDQCYHFDPQLRLRRAYVDGHLYRTQGDTLARLTRVRDGSRVELRREDLTRAGLDEMLGDIRGRLQSLLDGLTPSAECLAAIPSEADVGSRLIASLSAMNGKSIELAPAIRGRA